MFGLGKSGKNGSKLPFDLELEIKENPQKYHDLRNHIIDRMHTIKKKLLAGEVGKDKFNELGLILHGYVSMLKVLAKAQEKR